jgi:hypothetical protein
VPGRWVFLPQRAGRIRLDSVSDNKVVNDEANPAGGKNGYGKDDLPEKVKLVVLENVEHAPDGGYDTKNVNN